MFAARLRAFEPAGEPLGDALLDSVSWDASFPWDDVSALTLSYPTVFDAAGLLDRPVEVAVEVSDGGAWVEPANARFLSSELSANLSEDLDVPSFTFRGLASLLERAFILRPDENPGKPYTSDENDPKRNFLSATPGQIVAAVVGEARAKYPSMLQGISLGFTAGKDSLGEGWDKLDSVAYSPDTDLLRILEDMTARGVCDWWMQGRTLHLVNADSSIRTRDLRLLLTDATEAPLRATYENLATHVEVAGGDGKRWERPVAGAWVPYGAKVTRIANESVTTDGTALDLIERQRRLAVAARREYTRQVADTGRQPPFFAWRVGDWVEAENADGVYVPVRVFEAGLAFDSGDPTVEARVVLNDRFVDQSVRDAKRMQGITHGATQILGDGGIPSRVDKAVPAAPKGLTANSLGYWQDTTPLSSVDVTWQAVTTSVDGLALNGVDYYDVSVGGQSKRVTGTTVGFDGLQPSRIYPVQVRAVSTTGIRGKWSTPVNVLTRYPLPQLDPPTVPSFRTEQGAFQAMWDGMVQGDGAPYEPPLHFSHVLVEVRPETTLDWTRYSRDSGFVQTGLVAGTNYFVRFVAVDVLGNESAPGPAGEVTVVSSYQVMQEQANQIADEMAAEKGRVQAEFDQMMQEHNTAFEGFDERMNAASDAIDAAFNKATKAESDAAAAQTAANNAQAKANKAETDAAAAQTKANTAASDLLTLAGRTGRVIRSASAPTATADKNTNNLWLNTSTGQLSEWTGSKWQVITDSRLTAAASAADQAANLAGNAQSQADLAKTLAEAAQTTADAAESLAGSARSEAASAQATADTAKTNAATAQSTANTAKSDAATAAGIAEGKADVLIQAATPAAAMRKATTLWIDTTNGANTPKRWNGSAWVVVTDKAATDAAAAAAAAQSTANTAKSDAAAAQQAANAAGAAAAGAQYAADQASAKATTADGRYTVATANPVAADAVGKPLGAVWEVRSAGVSLRRYVLTGTSTWTQVKIGRDFIGENAVGRAQIGEAAVGTLQVANGTITNAKIGEAAVDTLQVAKGAITNAKIANLAVNSAKIADATIETGKIKDLQVDKLTATGGAKFPVAVIDSLVSDNAYLSSVYANRVVVDATDFAPGPGGYESAWSVTEGAAAFYSTDVDPSGKALRFDTTATQRARVRGPRLRVTPGQKIHGQARFYFPQGAPVLMQMYWFDSGQNYVGFSSFFAGADLPNGEYSGVVTVPDGAGWGQLVLTQEASEASPKRVARNLSVRTQTGAVLIENGAITTDKLHADSVTANAIKAGALDAFSITSPLIQSVSTANRGIKWNGSQFVGYTNDGSQAFRLDGAGATVTAGSASGQRIVLEPYPRLRMYDATRERVRFDGSGQMFMWSPNGVESLKIVTTNDWDGSSHLWGPSYSSARGYLRFGIETLEDTKSAMTRIGFTGGNNPAGMYVTGWGAFYMGGARGSVQLRNSSNELRLYSSASLIGLYGLPTTAGNGQVLSIIQGSSGFMSVYRTTSLRESKLDIRDVDGDPYRVLSLQPRTFYDKTMVEQYGDGLEAWMQQKEGLHPSKRLSMWEGTAAPKRIPGLIAEEVEETLPELVSYDGAGALSGVQYDRVGVYLIDAVKALKTEVDLLKGARSGA